MQVTKPLFIIKKYRSILQAAIIVEAVNFIVSLTDGIIAGNAIGTGAFAAIGLFAPFLSIATFFGSIVNTGTVFHFSYQVGRFDKRRANEFFSQGVVAALLTGALYAFALFLIGTRTIEALSPAEDIKQYLSEYYFIILLFIFLQPLSFLLDNLLVADGGEKLSVAANITLIVSNVVFSVVFAELWELKGIAIASVLSKVLFILIVCLHFLSKKNTLKFVLHWKWRDYFAIVRKGIVKASTYGIEAVLTFFINIFALVYFDENTLVILVVVERFMGLLTLFIGLSMACQPLIGTLRGESNTKAQSMLMKTVLRDMILVSGILSLLYFFGAPLITALFGIEESVVFYQAVSALRIVSSTLVLQALLVLFFIYYVFIDKQLLAFIICLIKNLISPVVLAVVFAIVLRSQSGIWIGLATAPILSIAVGAAIVFLRYGKKQFPFLIVENPEQQIDIYDFTIDSESAVQMSQTVQEILDEQSVPSQKRALMGVVVEDALILIKEKNQKAKKPVRAECTLITQPDGVRLIIRDSGVVFDLTDTDSRIGSLRQYVVSTLMTNVDQKLYMTTTGYNRNELFFSTDGTK